MRKAPRIRAKATASAIKTERNDMDPPESRSESWLPRRERIDITRKLRRQEEREVGLFWFYEKMHNTTAKLNVLFVCIGNSCRSPMAEAIALRDAADLFQCGSAGLSPLGVVQKQTLQTLQAN